MGERGHRVARVAEHDQLGLVRTTRPVVGRQRHAAGGQRAAHRTPEVETAPPTVPVADGETGGQAARERMDLPAQRGQVGTGGAQEVDLFERWPYVGARDPLDGGLLGEPAAYVVAD